MKNSSKPNSCRGSAIIVALVISFIGTLGVLATVSIISARGDLGEMELYGMDRQVKTDNSAALAKAVLYRRYLPYNATSGAEGTYIVPGDWGSAKVGAVSNAALSGSSLRTNPTGAAPSSSMTVDVDVQINSGRELSGADHYIEESYQLRSFSPILGGTLFNVHGHITGRQVTLSGNLSVKGGALFHAAPYNQGAALNLSADKVMIPNPHPTSPEPAPNFAGNPRISNFPNYPQTTGEAPSFNNFTGQLFVVNNPTIPSNSYVHKVLANPADSATLNGTTGAADAAGADTLPDNASVNNTLNTMKWDPDVTYAQFINALRSSYLSSNYMITMIYDRTKLSKPDMISILRSKAPLPDDVMTRIARPSTPLTEAERENLLFSTDFSYVNSGEETLWVNLDSNFLPNLVVNGVRDLILIGSNGVGSARTIAIDNQNTPLENVEFRNGTNTRQLILAARRNFAGPTTNFSFRNAGAFPRWNLILEVENVNANLNLNSGVSGATFIGGVRTDSDFRINGGTLTLDRETNDSQLQFLASRSTWIETYR